MNAYAAFAATLLALLCAFIMLAIFRGAATDAQNTVLRQWENGNLKTAPALLISPTWLGPAQIAGSFAAILAVCFWSLAVEGREVQKEVRRLQQLALRREGERVEVESEIERRYLQDTELATQTGQLKAQSAEAQAAIDAHPDLLDAQLETERGLEEAATGRLRTTYDYVNQIFANGKVVRIALATLTTRLGRRVTPAPGDAEGEPFREASPNGHKQMTPEELTDLL